MGEEGTRRQMRCAVVYRLSSDIWSRQYVCRVEQELECEDELKESRRYTQNGETCQCQGVGVVSSCLVSGWTRRFSSSSTSTHRRRRGECEHAYRNRTPRSKTTYMRYCKINSMTCGHPRLHVPPTCRLSLRILRDHLHHRSLISMSGVEYVHERSKPHQSHEQHAGPVEVHWRDIVRVREERPDEAPA
jgi:hypothetical protein